MLLTPAQIKSKSFESRRTLLFYLKWMRLMFTCVLGRLVASTVRISTQTFWRALTTSVDSCAEIKNAPSAA